MATSVKIQLNFHPGDTGRPFVHLFATRFNLVFSILQADISPDKGGRMVLDVTGEKENIEQAMAFTEGEGISVRILSRAIHWDDQVCVHCGACTAVCVQKALTLDQESAMLQFDNQRCVVCEMCLKACPTGAISVQFSK